MNIFSTSGISQPVISAPSTVSLAGKSSCSFLRNNPIAHPRTISRSPVDFRQGRRASDGLVAQGFLNQAEDVPVAFNSQRLHEVCKAKGFLELHLLQQEVASLSSQYQSFIPQEELHNQYLHNQFHVLPIATSNEVTSIALKPPGYKDEDFTNFSNFINKGSVNHSPDISNYYDLLNTDNGDKAINKNLIIRTDSQPGAAVVQSQASPLLQKPPQLQQQLMQHRLYQQKRQILQKQGSMETCLNRRQMLRQQSYKIAQNQQVLPPLPFPLNEIESEDLLAFQQTVENPDYPGLTRSIIIPDDPLSSIRCGMSALPNTLQSSCQINDIEPVSDGFNLAMYGKMCKVGRRKFKGRDEKRGRIRHATQKKS